MPYRWEQLFKTITDAGRFSEAVGALIEMKKFGLILPRIKIENANPLFLKSPEFKKSEPGIAFYKEHELINRLTAEAKAKLETMPPSEKPPKDYDTNVNCPFECCQLGKWKSRESVKIYKEMRSQELLFEIPKGIAVVALTGKVLVEPIPSIALKSIGIVKQGDIIYVLNILGEGGLQYWYKGKENPDLNTTIGSDNLYEIAQSNGQGDYWIKKLFPEKKYSNEWWVKVRVADKTGWVLMKNQFDGTDACGG